MMSRATGSEYIDLCNAIKAGYIAVDVLILKNGEYTKVGEYEIATEEVKPVVRTATSNPKKASDIAKQLGVTVKDKDDSVVKVDTKIESVSEVKAAAKPALDPVKAINNPKPRRSSEAPAKQEEPKTALEAVKENTEKDK